MKKNVSNCIRLKRLETSNLEELCIYSGPKLSVKKQLSLGKVLLVALERNVRERALALLKKTYMQ